MFTNGTTPDSVVNYSSALALCGFTAEGDALNAPGNAGNMTLPQNTPNCPQYIGMNWVASVTNWLCFAIDRAGLSFGPGNACQNPLLLYNAIAAIAASSVVSTRQFQTIVTYGAPGTFTFTVPAGIYRLFYEIYGGGGSGGSAQVVSPAAHGGAGGYNCGYMTVTPGQTITLVVGAGGASIAANNLLNGNTGGTTSFGALASAGGGTGGQYANGSVSPAGGVGGAATGGMMPITGQTGGASNSPTAPSNYGFGGGSPRMGGGGTNCAAGTAPGAGGSSGSNTIVSGAGANGAVFISY